MDPAKRLGDRRKAETSCHALGQYIRHQPRRPVDSRRDELLDDPAGNLLHCRIARLQPQAGRRARRLLRRHERRYVAGMNELDASVLRPPQASG